MYELGRIVRHGPICGVLEVGVHLTALTSQLFCGWQVGSVGGMLGPSAGDYRCLMESFHRV